MSFPFKKRVQILVDHPIRDLKGIALLASELAQNDVEVVLSPLIFQYEDSFQLKPSVVLVNYFRNNNVDYVRKMLDSNMKIALLDTEGGFYGDLEKYHRVLPTDISILDRVDQFYVWGHKMSDFWLNWMKMPAEKVKLTGSARFDLYHPNCRLNSKHKNQNAKPRILFNTKVALSNPAFQSVEQEKSLYAKLGFKQDEIDNIYKVGLQFIEKFTSLVKKTIEVVRDQAEVVVRPHPHEKPQTYQDLLQGSTYPVKVTNAGDFLDWLGSTILVIHRHCTTAIEAALMGIPAISPQWVPTTSNVPDAEALSYRPTTVEEFQELIKKSLSGQLPMPESSKQILEKIIHDWMYKFDGECHKRIAKECLKLLPGAAVIDSQTAHNFLRSRYDDRKGFKGKILKLSQSVSLGRFLVRYFRYRKWIKTSKSFNEADLRSLIASGLKIENPQMGTYIIRKPS